MLGDRQWLNAFRTDGERKRCIVGGHLSQGGLDDLTPTTPERIEHGLRGGQTGQRVGDRIADEFDALPDETTGDSGMPGTPANNPANKK